MKIVAVYSVKGGVGKTTAAVNLAWQAARTPDGRLAAADRRAGRKGKGKSKAAGTGQATPRVLLWDLDPQGAATYLLSVKPKLRGGAEALVRGKRSIADGVRSTAYPGLDVLPADASYRDLEIALDDAKSSTRRLEKALGPAARDYDVVVLDCPPGASLLAENVVRAADLVVVPLVPSPLSMRSLEQVAQLVAGVRKAPPVLAFLSMVDRRKTVHREAVAGLPARDDVLDVAVPYASVVERMGAERAPLATFAPRVAAAGAYADLWDAVAGRLAA